MMSTSSDECMVTREEIMADVVEVENMSNSIELVDSLLMKERQLQTARQMWAIFDAMGPGKAPKKCDRPFVGRQQEMYEECLALTVGKHKNELMLASLYEKVDKKLSAIEALFILKGLPESNVLIPLPKELTIIHGWFLELKAFENSRDESLKTQGGNSVLAKLLALDNLCFAVSYVTSEGSELLSFSTRRRGKEYDISITLNGNTLELKLERKEKEPDVEFSTNNLIHCVTKAVKVRSSAHKLVRHCFWKFIDKGEEAIGSMDG